MKFFEQVYLIALQEETAREYLHYIVPLANNGTPSEAEMDSINTKRFNKQLHDHPDLVDDYLQGKSVSEFKSEFTDFLNQLAKGQATNGATLGNDKKRAIQTMFNDYVAHFPKFRKYARIVENVISDF